MDNFEEALGNILSNPEAMSKISELSKSLGLSQSDTSSQKENTNSGFDISMLSNLLGGSAPKKEDKNPLSSLLNGSFSPELLSSLTRFLPLLQGMNKEDESTVLLNALRPFLSKDKRKRLDEAQKMLKIMRIIPKLKGTGIF